MRSKVPQPFYFLLFPLTDYEPLLFVALCQIYLRDNDFRPKKLSYIKSLSLLLNHEVMT